MANVQFGKYRLERPLAQGGMAEIYLARQSGPEGFEKVVVIKRVLQHLEREANFQKMFLDEARIAARLDHPGIVQIFDFGETDGCYYIAMEYLAGEDFASLVKAEQARRGTVPPQLAALMLSAVCDALHYAHTFVDEQGKPLNIVHRDISPSNLFLTYAGAVKVLDFGLAKAEGKKAHQTMDGQLKGKYLYMSPEQIHGKKLDARSDVFALGAVLHELLAGQPTFLRDEPVLILRAISEEPALPLADLVPGISPMLAQIVAKALEKDPARRFQTALEMRQALDAYLATTTPGSPTALLQDYVRALIPAEEIQKKSRPFAVAPPKDDEDSELEPDLAPTRLRMQVVEENSGNGNGKVSSTLRRVEAVSPDDKTPNVETTQPELAPIKVDERESVDQDGATVLEAPAFRRDEVSAPPPKKPTPPPRASLKPVARRSPEVELEDRPTDRGIDVKGLKLEPSISALETAKGQTLSPLAQIKQTQVLDLVNSTAELEPVRPGLLATLGLRTTQDVVLAGLGVLLLAIAFGIFLWIF